MARRRRPEERVARSTGSRDALRLGQNKPKSAAISRIAAANLAVAPRREAEICYYSRRRREHHTPPHSSQRTSRGTQISTIQGLEIQGAVIQGAVIQSVVIQGAMRQRRSSVSQSRSSTRPLDELGFRSGPATSGQILSERLPAFLVPCAQSRRSTYSGRVPYVAGVGARDHRENGCRKQRSEARTARKSIAVERSTLTHQGHLTRVPRQAVTCAVDRSIPNPLAGAGT